MNRPLLLVDDELEALEGAQFFFEAQGIPVLTAQGGHEALALIKACQPKVVMLDIKMRGMSGVEILRKAKELDPAVSVVMVTGLNDEGLEEECLSLGASSYLHKPVRMEELESLVHTLYAHQ